MENHSINLLREVDSFSNSALKKRDDLHKLFDEIIRNQRHSLLEEVSFTAKYVKGLMRVLKGVVSNPEIENMEHVKNDLSHNMNKILDLLKEAVSESDESTRNYFNAEYFQMTQESFKNLNDLLSDLEWTKRYLNHQKRQNAS